MVLLVKMYVPLNIKRQGKMTENVKFNSKVKLIASRLGFRIEEKYENILTLHKAIFQNENFALDMHMKIFLSDKLNLDPLEEHFGKERMKGEGSNE